MKEKIKEESMISPIAAGTKQTPEEYPLPQYVKESPKYSDIKNTLDDLKNRIELREGLITMLAKEQKAGNTEEMHKLAEQVLNLGNEIMGTAQKITNMIEGETKALEYLHDDVPEHTEH